MAAAAARTGISIEMLKRAKRLGCPNFKGGRVESKGLAKWIAEHSEALTNSGSGNGLKDQKTAEEIRKLKIKNDRDESKLVLRSEVAAAIRRAMGQVSSICEAKLVNEYPSAVAGLDVAQARVYGRRVHDGLMAECQKLSKEFPA